MKKAGDESGSVLLVANYASDVGYAWWLMENYWAHAAASLAEKGVKCHLIYPSLRAVPSVVQEAPVSIHEISMDEKSARANDELDRFVVANRVRSLYLTDRAYSAPYYAHLRKLGVRTIVLHDHTPGDRPRVSGVKGLVKSLMLHAGSQSCDWYVATTEFIRRRMVENGNVRAARTIVVPNGVRPSAKSAAERDRARSEFQAHEDHVVVGLVGRASKIKGIDFAIACASEIRRRSTLSPVKFVFIGDGPELEVLRIQASLAGLTDDFVFLGRRDDARRLMQGFDIGFHPSRGEVGYCLAILEMMDAGLPVVVPDLESVRGATEDGETGFVYRAESVVDAADTLLKLIDSSQLRTSTGERAAVSIRDRFDLAVTNRVFVDEVVSRL